MCTTEVYFTVMCSMHQYQVKVRIAQAHIAYNFQVNIALIDRAVSKYRILGYSEESYYCYMYMYVMKDCIRCAV